MERGLFNSGQISITPVINTLYALALAGKISLFFSIPHLSERSSSVHLNHFIHISLLSLIHMPLRRACQVLANRLYKNGFHTS